MEKQGMKPKDVLQLLGKLLANGKIDKFCGAECHGH